jgi:general stress protein 26
MTDEHQTKNLAELVDGIRFAMLTTSGPDGLDSRPLTVQRVDDAATVWFLVGSDADWLHHLDTPVNLAFVSDKTWVSATGTATTTTDQAILDDLGDPASDAWFGAGTSPLALKVAVQHGGWWASPGAVRTLLSVASAKVTGNQPSAGESGDIA